MPGMHRVPAPSTTLSRGEPLLLNQQFPNHPIYMVRHTALGLSRVTQSLHFPYMMRRDLLFQVWCHQMTWSTLNLWWALNLVIPVSWLDIRLMSLLTPGWQSSLLPAPTFILGSLVRCHHWPTFPCLLTLNKAWLHPHWFTWDTRIGHFLEWAWGHYIFSLFWVSPLG